MKNLVFLHRFEKSWFSGTDRIFPGSSVGYPPVPNGTFGRGATDKQGKALKYSLVAQLVRAADC